MGTFPQPRGFGGTIPTKEWVLPPAAAGDEASILPEGEVSGGHTGVEDGEAEAESSAVTESFVEMMGVQVGPGDSVTPLLPEAALPVRHAVRVPSMKKSPSGAGSGAQKRAARPTRVIWPLRTRRPRPPRKAGSPRSLWLPHRRELLLHPPQPVFLLPEVGASSLPEGCHHAEAEVGGGPLHPFAQAGPLQPSLWPPRSLQPVPCRVRSL